VAQTTLRLVDRTFTLGQWEEVCRRCGRCCFEKEPQEDGTVLYHDIPCDQLTEDNLCAAYDRRFEVEPHCHQVTPAVVREGRIIPASCGYVKLYEELLDELEERLRLSRRG